MEMMRTNVIRKVIGVVKGLLPFYLFVLLPLSAQAGDYNIVPLPQSIALQKGEPFTLDATVQILAPSALQQEAEFLQFYLRDMVGLDFSVVQKRAKKKACGNPRAFFLSLKSAGLSFLRHLV